MNCSPTLTANDFKTVHNALCELRSIHYSLQAVVREPILDKFAAAISAMEQGLKGAYEQDNQAFDSKWNQYNHWREHYGLHSTWSIYEVESMTQLHCYGDAQYVVYDQHWGEGGEVVRRIEGHDWLALYRAADAAIQASGDGHHTFIESFEPIEDRPGHLRLSTGS